MGTIIYRGRMLNKWVDGGLSQEMMGDETDIVESLR